MRAIVIGIGALAHYLFACIERGEISHLEVAGLVGRAGSEDRLAALGERLGCAYATNALQLADVSADVAIEVASQAAVRQYAAALLERQLDLVLMSVGALADPSLTDAIKRAARQSGRRVYLPSGAIGGLDVLRAAKCGGLYEVMLTLNKPPIAFANAPFVAQRGVDLAGITERTVLFDGNAAEATRWFPSNANIAALVAAAGIGLTSTRVRIVADPTIHRNNHDLLARGAFGEMRLQLNNVPSPGNLRTSLLACLSLVATLQRLFDPIQVG
jgi:aspartate dehydrogenase